MSILKVGESYTLRLFKLQTTEEVLLKVLEAEHELIKKARLKKGGITQATEKLSLLLATHLKLTKNEIADAIKYMRDDVEKGNVVYSKNDDGIQVTYRTDNSPYSSVIFNKHPQIALDRDENDVVVDIPGVTRPIAINEASKKKNKEELDIEETSHIYIYNSKIKENIKSKENEEMGKGKNKNDKKVKKGETVKGKENVIEMGIATNNTTSKNNKEEIMDNHIAVGENEEEVKIILDKTEEKLTVFIKEELDRIYNSSPKSFDIITNDYDILKKIYDSRIIDTFIKAVEENYNEYEKEIIIKELDKFNVSLKWIMTQALILSGCKCNADEAIATYNMILNQRSLMNGFYEPVFLGLSKAGIISPYSTEDSDRDTRLDGYVRLSLLKYLVDDGITILSDYVNGKDDIKINDSDINLIESLVESDFDTIMRSVIHQIFGIKNEDTEKCSDDKEEEIIPLHLETEEDIQKLFESVDRENEEKRKRKEEEKKKEEERKRKEEEKKLKNSGNKSLPKRNAFRDIIQSSINAKPSRWFS